MIQDQVGHYQRAQNEIESCLFDYFCPHSNKSKEKKNNEQVNIADQIKL